MQGEAERALRCRPPSLPNRPHFDADSIDSAIPRPSVHHCLLILAYDNISNACDLRGIAGLEDGIWQTC